jgi:hypothetical protein
MEGPGRVKHPSEDEAARELRQAILDWGRRSQNRQLMRDAPASELRASWERSRELKGSILTNLRFLALWHGSQACLAAEAKTDPTDHLLTANTAARLEVAAGRSLHQREQGKRQRFRLWRSATALHAARALAGCLDDDAHFMYEVLSREWHDGIFNPEPSFIASFVLRILSNWFGESATQDESVLPRPYLKLVGAALAADSDIAGA